MKLRESPRLKGFDYRGPFAYNVTFVTRRRQPIFTAAHTVELCLNCLQEAAQRHGFDVLAYCFMPDHLHLLVAGRQKSSLRDFAHLFKQISGYRFKREHDAALWQISYYDHVLRREESVQKIAAYIWDNPLRAGLERNRLDYAFAGPREFMEQA